MEKSIQCPHTIFILRLSSLLEIDKDLGKMIHILTVKNSDSSLNFKGDPIHFVVKFSRIMSLTMKEAIMRAVYAPCKGASYDI